MSRHDPREARTLGLWTAAWLGGLLLAGLLWVGDLSLQWPVLLVPVLWAVVAARPRRDRRRGIVEPPDDLGYRTDTVERPALRPPDRRDGWS
jgi:multidrug efflux pump subunit AcrA (membrane-fusion protein)